MIIQFNTGHHVKGNEALTEPYIALITEELHRFSTQITRVEVHLTDQNGKKSGVNDKRCVMEARLEGMQPLAVTNDANTYKQAVEGAIEKLKHTLESTLDRKNKSKTRPGGE